MRDGVPGGVLTGVDIRHKDQVAAAVKPWKTGTEGQRREDGRRRGGQERVDGGEKVDEGERETEEGGR